MRLSRCHKERIFTMLGQPYRQQGANLAIEHPNCIFDRISVI